VNDSLPSSNSNKTELVKPFSVDASDSESVKKLVESAAGAWGPSAVLSVGIWNPNAGFGMRPFMEWTEEQVEMAVRVQV
jgi:NAD(P)-dependent dehydrogenase (short-subunit alcohol dehydrogenase family)